MRARFEDHADPVLQPKCHACEAPESHSRHTKWQRKVRVKLVLMLPNQNIESVGRVHSSHMISTAGCAWSTINWSCAYDSVFMIMYYVFCSASGPWQLKWQATGQVAHSLCEMFTHLSSLTQHMTSGHMFNDMCDAFQDLLFSINPSHFPQYGQVGTSVSKVMLELTPAQDCHPLLHSVCVNGCASHISPMIPARTRHCLPTICSRSAWLRIVRDSGMGSPDTLSVSTQTWVKFFLQAELNDSRESFAASTCKGCNSNLDT